jgi:purine-binding chemotaxis protein CheW
MKNNSLQFLGLRIDEFLFGVPVEFVQDVLLTPASTPIPLAPPSILGLINLRGRIVTAIDMGICLGLTTMDMKKNSMCVIIEHEHDLYALVVDTVGEVMTLSPPISDSHTLDETWQKFSIGVHALEKELMVLIDCQKFMESLLIS